MKRRRLVIVPAAAALAGLTTPAALRAQGHRVIRLGTLDHADLSRETFRKASFAVADQAGVTDQGMRRPQI